MIEKYIFMPEGIYQIMAISVYDMIPKYSAKFGNKFGY
jgi:hypothetical protein